MKKLLFGLLTLMALAASAQNYNQNGILPGTTYNSSSTIGGGLNSYYSGLYINFALPSNLSASQTVIMPGSADAVKKVAQTATPSTPGSVTDTLYSETHITHLDSVHGLQTITYYADPLLSTGAKVILRTYANPGDSARTVYVKFGSTAVDTITTVYPTTTKWRTYVYNGTSLEPLYK
jgi:hypothetical protein